MYFTPNRRLGFSLPPSPSPFTTPRSERRPSDCRWADGITASHRNDRDKEVNVQVMVRCRPLSDEEQRANVQNVILCNEQKKEVTVMQSLAGRQQDKSFSFDKVFGPKAQQRSIYEHAISPIVNDTLEGFNCTVFAYGQTGTGKTFTMEGDIRSKGGELSAEAGVIPRAVRQIFDALDAQKADYSVKVTFLELYNEEIFDLLTPEDGSKSMEDKLRRPISLMEDGKGGAVIRGLEEVVVYGVNEIFSLLEQGSSRRRTGETLLNKQSSRSHSIFSITVHVKEATAANEELIKCGRLNLVDLAGSENISRSGARENRAREAGELNKSLLTLGRVITALVEHSGHVPYRDSKLTRFLRDSLGGKAKTCIISTISPSSHCLEETLNTLDYAYRAKGIKNKPEVNQKLTKSVLLKELYLEIEKMKQDVKAAREKNGVYIPHERFLQDEAEKKAMREKVERLEYDLDRMKTQSDSLQELYHSEQERCLDLDCKIKKQKEIIEVSKKAMSVLQEEQRKVNVLLNEKDLIILKLKSSENAILQQARELHSNVEFASREIATLQSEIDHKAMVESKNQHLIVKFRSNLDQSLKNLQETVSGCVSKQHHLLRDMEAQFSSFIGRKRQTTKDLEAKIKKLKSNYLSGATFTEDLAVKLHDNSSLNMEELTSVATTEKLAIENLLIVAATEAEEIIHHIQILLEEQKRLQDFSTQQQEVGLDRTLETCQTLSGLANDLFNDLSDQASRFFATIKEMNEERSQKLAHFRSEFQETSIKEEKDALEKISRILSALTSRKIKMVSDAVDDVEDTCLGARNKLEREVSELKENSSDARKEWLKAIDALEIQSKKDGCLEREISNTASNAIVDCSNKVVMSAHHWRSTLSAIDALHRDFGAEIQSSFKRGVFQNQDILEEFMSRTSTAKTEFGCKITDMLDSVHNSLARDHEAKNRELDPITATFSDRLMALEESHSRSTGEIRHQTEISLSEYQVLEWTQKSKENLSISIPSMESIEALQARIENIAHKGKEEKISLPNVETPRNPFRAING